MRQALAQPTTQAGPQALRTLIVGLGETGYSVARFLAGRGVPIAGTDSRLQPPALERLRETLPDLALFLGSFDPAAFDAADQLIVSPGADRPPRPPRRRGGCETQSGQGATR